MAEITSEITTAANSLFKKIREAHQEADALTSLVQKTYPNLNDTQIQDVDDAVQDCILSDYETDVTAFFNQLQKILNA